MPRRLSAVTLAQNFPSRPALFSRGVDAPAHGGVHAFSRGLPTTSPTKGRRRPRSASRRLRAWQRPPARRRRRRRSRREPPHARDDLIVVALGHSIRSLDLPIALFDDLVSAFGQDTMTTRYASWADVLRLLPSIGESGRAASCCGSPAIATRRSIDRRTRCCTALQLTNFWQDFGRDWRAGRLYVPRDVHGRYGARRSSTCRAAG